MKVDMQDNRKRNTSTGSGTCTQQPQQLEFYSSAVPFCTSASGVGSDRVNRPQMFFVAVSIGFLRVSKSNMLKEALKQKEIMHCFRCLKPGNSLFTCRSKVQSFLIAKANTITLHYAKNKNKITTLTQSYPQFQLVLRFPKKLQFQIHLIKDILLRMLAIMERKPIRKCALLKFRCCSRL